MSTIEELRKNLEQEKKKVKELQERLTFQNKQLEVKDKYIKELENKINENENLNVSKSELRQEYIMNVGNVCEGLIHKLRDFDPSQPYETMEFPKTRLDQIYERHLKNKRKELMNDINNHTYDLIETVQTLNHSKKEKDFINLTNEVFTALIEKLNIEKKKTKKMEIIDSLLLKLKLENKDL